MSEKLGDNWYEILELNYYLNPEEDEQEIRRIIEEKNKYWVRNQKDRKHEMIYTKYIEHKKNGKILKDVLDDNKRIQMIRDVQKRLFEGVDRYLFTFEGGVITEEKIQYILNKMKQETKVINKEIIKERIWMYGKKIGIYNYEEFSKKLKEVLNIKLNSEFEDFEKNLKKLGKDNVYEFLHSEGLTLNFLTKKGLELKIKSLREDDFEIRIKKRVYLFCRNLLEKNKIEKYNEYLEKLECLRIEKELNFIRDDKRRLSKKRIENEIESFGKKFDDIVEERTVKEIFSKYFGYEFLNDKNKHKFRKINIFKMRELIKLRKKTVFMIFTGIMCIFITIVSWNQYNKREAEKIFKQAEKYRKERNKEKAIELYELAAKKGNIDAMKEAMTYYTIKNNKKKAREWSEKLVKKGDAEALNVLGLLEGNMDLNEELR